MRDRTRRRSTFLAAALMAAMLPGAVSAAGGTVVTVNPSNLGVDWLQETMVGGAGAFEAGPGTPPLGDGSYAMRTYATNVDKVTLTTSTWFGRALSDIQGLDYWTYRDGSSTSADFVAPSINISIFTNATGPGSGFATLVYEPLYAFGNDAIDDDVWQHWDTFAPTQTGFAGGWWATRQVGAICPSACYVSFATLLANAPDATIIGVGVNVGRGPASFIGAVDGLSLTVAGETTTFDFEPLDVSKDGCKDGGWADFNSPEFKNQGDCVSFFASAKRQGPKDAAFAAKADRRADKAEEAATKAAEKAANAATKSAKPTSTADADDPAPADADEATPKGSDKAKGGAGNGKDKTDRGANGSGKPDKGD